MALLDLAASPLISSGIGILGTLGNGILAYFRNKQEHAFALEDKRLDMEKMKLQGELDAAKLAGILAAEREKGASDAFTASQQSELRTGRGARWASTMREATRPLLTWFYQILMLLIAVLVLRGWAIERIEDPVMQYIIISVINTATMTVSWWFGQRQLDKVQIRWGNRTAGASVGPKQ